jgi:hypothetical protein
VLDVLGEEVTGIVAPVSVCMALTVVLVRILNPDGVSRADAVYIASIAYEEQVNSAPAHSQARANKPSAPSRTSHCTAGLGYP